ncbi:glycoside hydrolase family 85 protein [Atractiella rhizophila]|nr:glycoside hydrolase family 85 protein [Atractiella rhizophila]
MPPTPSTVHQHSLRRDYFDSLADLDASWADCVQNTIPTHLPFAPRAKRNGPKILVCHDYKGGYYEGQKKREYVFQYWHLIDAFIYFSHHRITIPPPSWLIAAHRNGVQMFGTLILEWEEARADLFRLVLGPAAYLPNGNETFDDPFTGKQPSEHYIDKLVSIAAQRGFTGWLVNVELPTGAIRRRPNSSDTYLAFSYSHACLLAKWLDLFRVRMKEKIGEHSCVMWYDSVTKEGRLAWQNAVNSSNTLFYEASDAIFLNYHWTEASLKSTSTAVQELEQSAPAALDERSSSAPSSDLTSSSPSMEQFHSKGTDLTSYNKPVFVGIDCFGRGVFAGGGFNTGQAIKKILSIDSRLSIALFAPGWTSESDVLKHNISGSDNEWQAFFKDDYFLWHGWEGKFLEGQKDSLHRFVEARYVTEKKTLQEHRVINIAALSTRQSELGRLPPLTIPDYRDNDIHSFQPIVDLIATKPPPSYSNGIIFYTNFSFGSSTKFFVEGKNVLNDEEGWTDPTMCFPLPDLLFQPPSQFTTSVPHCKIETVDHMLPAPEGWLGPAPHPVVLSRF